MSRRIAETKSIKSVLKHLLDTHHKLNRIKVNDLLLLGACLQDLPWSRAVMNFHGWLWEHAKSKVRSENLTRFPTPQSSCARQRQPWHGSQDL
jgi:hypothetical protein